MPGTCHVTWCVMYVRELQRTAFYFILFFFESSMPSLKQRGGGENERKCS